MKTGLVTAATWLFNATLWANPITWVVIGIMALIAAVVLLIVYWDEVVAWLEKGWNWFVDLLSVLQPFWELLENIAKIIAIVVVGAVNLLIEGLKSLFNWIEGKIGPLIESFTENLDKLWGKFKESKAFKFFEKTVNKYVLPSINKIIEKSNEMDEKVSRNLSSWIENFNNSMKDISWSDVFSIDNIGLQKLWEKIKKFSDDLYNKIVKSESFKKISNFIQEHLVEPFREAWNSVVGFVKKMIEVYENIKNGKFMEQLTNYVEGKISFGDLTKSIGIGIDIYDRTRNGVDAESKDTSQEIKKAQVITRDVKTTNAIIK